VCLLLLTFTQQANGRDHASRAGVYAQAGRVPRPHHTHRAAECQRPLPVARHRCAPPSAGCPSRGRSRPPHTSFTERITPDPCCGGVGRGVRGPEAVAEVDAKVPREGATSKPHTTARCPYAACGEVMRTGPGAGFLRADASVLVEGQQCLPDAPGEVLLWIQTPRHHAAARVLRDCTRVEGEGY
jgi:hypothetical protein